MMTMKAVGREIDQFEYWNHGTLPFCGCISTTGLLFIGVSTIGSLYMDECVNEDAVSDDGTEYNELGVAWMCRIVR
jgi:hypothetical protein